jgi:hypothetical protein
MKKIIMSLVLLLIIATTTKAQDKIYLKGKTGYVKAKVIEVGLDEIKYKEYANEEGVTYTVEKDDIEKIEYQNGKKETFFNPMATSIKYDDMKKNILKFNVFKPLSGSSYFSLEHAVKMGQSYEAHIVGVGLGTKQVAYNDPRSGNGLPGGTDYYAKQKGVVLGFSYKAIFLPDFVQRGVKYRHLLQGSFVRPTVYIGNYSANKYKKVYQPNAQHTIGFDRKNYSMAGFMIELGKQWIFSNQISLELYVGIGYGTDNKKTSINDIDNFNQLVNSNYAFTRPGLNTKSTSIAFNSGIKMGYLFHWKKLDGKKKIEAKKK